MANDVIDIFDDNPRKAMDKVRKQYESRFSDDMQRAAEIAVEEYENFLGEAGDKGITGILRDADVVMKKRRKTKSIDRNIQVGVPSTGDNVANIIFHVLDEGRDALGAASNYGIKAWPMALPRSAAHGNFPMTVAGSPQLRAAFSNESVVFRPVISEPILPRNFTDEILRRIQVRLDDEGLGYIRVEKDQQEL